MLDPLAQKSRILSGSSTMSARPAREISTRGNGWLPSWCNSFRAQITAFGRVDTRARKMLVLMVF
jgi:hypothetical protein